MSSPKQSGRIVIVVDTSVLVSLLVDSGTAGTAVRERLAGSRIAAPELVDLETAQTLRKLVSTGALPLQRAEHALQTLGSLPLARATHSPLLGRCWELRNNLSIYDAAFVALAESLGGTLLTADKRLAASPGIRCSVELITGQRRPLTR
jgi:predicted nucleic acid-binding protein